MNKFGVLLVAILIGLLGSIVFFNQGQKSERKNIIPKITQSPVQSSLGQTPSPILNPSPTPSKAENISQFNTAVIKTERGDIAVTLYPDVAPNTVANFVSKAKNGFYNDLTFHRVEDWVVQGGDPLGNGTGGDNMPVEFNSKPFVVGSLGIASRGDGKIQNDSQFFITKKDSVFLNGQYTNFGIVTKGMDVVEKIEVGDKILGIEIP